MTTILMTTTTENSKAEECILSFGIKSNDHRQASWWIWQRRNSRTADELVREFALSIKKWLKTSNELTFHLEVALFLFLDLLLSMAKVCWRWKTLEAMIIQIEGGRRPVLTSRKNWGEWYAKNATRSILLTYSPHSKANNCLFSSIASMGWCLGAMRRLGFENTARGDLLRWERSIKN